jgi:putative DNA primase/helicase
MTTTAHAEALDCAYRRWPVVPLHWPIGVGRCSCGRECGSVGKHPMTRNGVRDASTDFATVAAWFARWPDANYAVCAGRAAGLTVLDVDGPEGEASLEALVRAHGALPETAEVSTGRGMHVYLRWVEGSTNRARVRPGLDVRTDGGYVVGPGSVHGSGAVYEWARRKRVAEAPAWLRALLSPKPREPRPAEMQRSHARELSASMMYPAPEGQRNWGLYRFACWLVHRATPGQTAQLLTQANDLRCSPPLSAAEVAIILGSAERHRRPR